MLYAPAKVIAGFQEWFIQIQDFSHAFVSYGMSGYLESSLQSFLANFGKEFI